MLAERLDLYHLRRVSFLILIITRGQRQRGSKVQDANGWMTSEK